MTREPLLTGDDAQRAWRAIDAIADALTARDYGGWGLEGGGAAIHFYDLLARARSDERAAARADELLERALDALERTEMHAGLLGGFPGVVCVARRVAAAARLELPGDAFDAIDAAVLERVRRSPWCGHYDLMNGIVGLGVYGLVGAPRPACADIVAEVVARLDELAERCDDGITWFTPPALLWGADLARYPHGYHDLGVAHGVAGAIGVLARACAAGVEADRARALRDGATRWLLAQARFEPDVPCLPSLLSVDGDREWPSLAWCYGDLGTAAALVAAAHAARDADTARIAADIGVRAAGRADGLEHANDACLCHGAAGAGHLFHRLHHATGDARFAVAARTAFRHALARWAPGTGVGGFSAWNGKARALEPDYGFLTGAAGVGLALLSAVSAEEPAWDDVLLCAS